jgi:hypothetical protein
VLADVTRILRDDAKSGREREGGGFFCQGGGFDRFLSVRTHGTFFGILLVVVLPSTARSDGDSTEPAEIFTSKIRGMGNLGLASAVGEVGGTFTYSPVPAFQIELGVGFGITGLQLSLMPKLSLGHLPRYHLILGLGPSLSGLHKNVEGVVQYSLWLNGEAGYEHRSPSGFAFLVAGGFTYALASDQTYRSCYAFCDSDENYPVRHVAGSIYPQGRIAFGRWF